MAKRKLGSGDGFISDDSSFYGDEAEQLELENTSARFNPRTSLQVLYHSSIVTNVASTARARAQEIASTPKISKRSMEPSAQSQVPTPPDLHNPYEGKSDARQLSETIAEFTKRLPVSSLLEDVGPWIWIANPHRGSFGRTGDAAKLVEKGEQLLKGYNVEKDKLEKANVGMAQSTITRKLKQFRDQLQDDIEGLSRETKVTHGKWLLFPKEDKLPRVWRIVAEAVADNRLGDAAKVATIEDPTSGARKDGRLIFVYTKDYFDTDDVRRVLQELVAMGLVNVDASRGIYYKTDAYTLLDIMSKNKYGLRASKYSSKDMLGSNATQKPRSQQTNKNTAPQKRQMTLGGFRR